MYGIGRFGTPYSTRVLLLFTESVLIFASSANRFFRNTYYQCYWVLRYKIDLRVLTKQDRTHILFQHLTWRCMSSDYMFKLYSNSFIFVTSQPSSTCIFHSVHLCHDFFWFYKNDIVYKVPFSVEGCWRKNDDSILFHSGLIQAVSFHIRAFKIWMIIIFKCKLRHPLFMQEVIHIYRKSFIKHTRSHTRNSIFPQGGGKFNFRTQLNNDDD